MRISFITIATLSFVLAGCANPPRNDVAEPVATSVMSPIQGLQDKSIAIQVDMAYLRKQGGNGGDALKIEPVQRVADKDMERGLIFEDARLQLKTNAQLDLFEKYIYKIAERSAAKIVSNPAGADYVLHAKLTFGPMPAPAYRDVNAAKTLGISLLTMGLGPRSWSAVVDYTVDLRLDSAEGKTIAHYKEKVQANSEQLKSGFNSSRDAEVQEDAIIALNSSFVQNLNNFIERVNQGCARDC